MEYREPRFYPFYDLGGMYVHTNYDSFKHNLGSFGDHFSSEIDELANRILHKQRGREEEIGRQLQELYGNDLSLKAILQFFVKPRGLFDRMKEAYITAIDEAETDFVIKFTHWAYAQFDIGKDAAHRMESLLNPMMDSLNQINVAGYINKESLEKAKSSIESSIGNLRLKDKDTEQNSIAKTVRSIKGFIWEVYMARFMIEALKSIDNIEDFEVILLGRGRVADLKIDFKSFSIGINIKSASTNTFQGDYGITLFSQSTLKNISSMMEKHYKTMAVEAFKYYVINISRMKASPLSGVSAAGLGHSQEGLKLIKSILGTYATIFIGEQETFEGGEVNELKQADILFTVDRVYLKSEILESLASEKTEGMENMESFLKITYSSQGDWRQFDQIKRRVMNYEKGDYKAAMNRTYMRTAVDSLLNQQASVKLRLLK